MAHTRVQTSTGTCARVHLPGCRGTRGYRSMQHAHKGCTCVCTQVHAHLPGCRGTHGYRSMQRAHRWVHTRVCTGARTPTECRGTHWNMQHAHRGCTCVCMVQVHAYLHGCPHRNMHRHWCAHRWVHTYVHKYTHTSVQRAQAGSHQHGTIHHHAPAPSLPCTQGLTGPQNSQGTPILWVHTEGHWQLIGFCPIQKRWLQNTLFSVLGLWWPPRS